MNSGNVPQHQLALVFRLPSLVTTSAAPPGVGLRCGEGPLGKAERR
jgi:hypothetical protein